MIRFKNIKNNQKRKIMENPIKHSYHIDGMSCGGCDIAVKNKLFAAHSVTLVSVDLKRKEAEISSSAIITADTL